MLEYVLSIDLRATSVRVAIISSNLDIVEVNREKVVKNDKAKLTKQIFRLIESLPYDKYNVKKIGVSAPGLIENGVIKILPNLGIVDYDLKKALEDQFKMKCEIKNDANCAALAEATYGASKGVNNSFLLTIGSGIGGCLIYKHKCVDLAFEVGHTYMKYHNNLEEFEKICSGDGISRICKDNYLIVEDSIELFELVKKQVPLALKVLDEWENYIALFIANKQIEFNTEMFVLTGGLMNSGDYFMEHIEEKANKIVGEFPVNPVKLVRAQFDQDAGLMGGLSVALSIK